MMRMIGALLLLFMAIPLAAQDASLETQAQAVLAVERAFDAAAARDGQWTAFRAFAASDATMFTPQPVNAQGWLSGRADPPHSVRWQPHDVYISCDATLAVTTGAWQRANGTFGYFTTVWRKQGDGTWKWVLDHGDELAMPRATPDAPIVHLPACVSPRQRFGQTFDAPVGAVIYAGDGSMWVTWSIDSGGVREIRVNQLHSNSRPLVLSDTVLAP